MRAGETTDSDIVITEVGGTVGDIESLPFLEALRQMRMEVGAENVLYIHTTLIPYLRAAGELKTKPTQHSVKELRSLGIQPNILVVRTEMPLPQHIKNKLASFCDVKAREAVIESRDNWKRCMKFFDASGTEHGPDRLRLSWSDRSAAAV